MIELFKHGMLDIETTWCLVCGLQFNTSEGHGLFNASHISMQSFSTGVIAWFNLNESRQSSSVLQRMSGRQEKFWAGLAGAVSQNAWLICQVSACVGNGIGIKNIFDLWKWQAIRKYVSANCLPHSRL